jgi:hypothetical protein
MNFLVFLHPHAGELEKILSGVKRMIVKDFDPTQPTAQPVRPGDSLYFLRNKDDCIVRVKATVTRVLFFTDCMDLDLSHTLKEMQPRLQLTEDQYNDWAVKKQAALVEFDDAQKISAIQVAVNKTTDRSDWIAFEAFDLIA